LRDDAFGGLTFERQAIAERPKDRVGDAVGLFVLAEVLREVAEMRERVADGRFERGRVVAGCGGFEACAKRIGGLVLRRRCRRCDVRPVVGRFVDAKAALRVLDDLRLASVA
jgi:hypothetical protein